jgi:GGDEF domain-containing protein
LCLFALALSNDRSVDPETKVDPERRAQVLASILRRLRDAFCSPSKATKTLVVVIVLLALLGSAWLVHVTGGAQFATLHLVYLPIILAALVFGTGGGIVTGVVAGLLLGPYILLDTAGAEAQQLGNWLLRMVFFCIVGGVVGIAASTLRRQLKMLDWLNEHDAGTGLLNSTGFARTQRQAIERDGAQVLLIVVQIKNLLDIQNTFGALFSEKLLKLICERGRELVPADVPIALIQRDRLALAFDNRTETRHLRSEIEARVRCPYQIDGVPVHVDFAFGAAEFPQHARSFEELFQKASIAAHTAVTRHLPFHTYDSAADSTSRENLELLGMFPLRSPTTSSRSGIKQSSRSQPEGFPAPRRSSDGSIRNVASFRRVLSFREPRNRHLSTTSQGGSSVPRSPTKQRGLRADIRYG